MLEGPQRDVRLAVPPDMGAIDIGHSLLAQLPINLEAGRVTLEVTASPPAALLDQPGAGESVEDWLEEAIDDNLPARGPTSTQLVSLPAGRALRLRTSSSAAMPADVIILYAIETSAGFGRLHILGLEPTIEARSDDLELITLLLEFGPGPAD